VQKANDFHNMKSMYHRVLLSSLLLILFHVGQSQLKINEVMSSNTTTILDEDNDDPDWIELFNSSNETIQLEGYTISDSSNEWQLPKMSIRAQKHLLIFASGKDRKEVPIQWNTIIDIGDEWRYNIPNSDTPSSWKQNTFDDSTWPQGKSGFGYGDNDDSTIIDNTISLFIRKSFEINHYGLKAP
jgi:hypothetical protein